MSSTTQRTAIVTGAARGIGAATAIRLAADGHAVAVLDLDEQPAPTRFPRSPRPVGARSPSASTSAGPSRWRRPWPASPTSSGAPTILVNNAGIIRDNLIFRMTVEDWDAVMNVHLRGAFLMTKAVQAHMSAEKYGRIVNLSSTSAQGNRGQVNYSAAKAGLQGFTKTLAIELGRFNVTANAVAPGFIATDMTRQTAERMKVSFEDFIAGALGPDPGRPGRSARGHRQHDLVPHQRAVRVRLRPGHLRRRWPPGLSGCTPPSPARGAPGTDERLGSGT